MSGRSVSVRRGGRLGGSWAARALLLLPLTFLGLFFVYPLFEIFRESFASDGFSLAPFGDILGDDFFLGRIWFTLWQAVASTLLTLALGLPSAYIFARYDFPAKTLIRALTTVPFVMPTIVVAFGFVALVGANGILPLNLTSSIWIILLAHTFFNYTVVVRTVSALWAHVDPKTEEAARLLGAGPLQVFWCVTLPQIRPAILAAASLVFLFSFTSFGVVLILGGPQFATVEVTIYNLTARLFRLELAAALSLIQLAVTFGVMLFYARFQERSAVPLNFQPRAAGARRPRGRREGLLILSNFLVVLAIVLAPLLALVERSFSGSDGYTLAHYSGLETNTGGRVFFVSLSGAMKNSLWFAGATMLVAVPLGTIIAFALARARGRLRTLADALFMLPLGASAITLAFGILIALDSPPLNLRASWVVLVIAHSLIAYPFVVRSVLAVVRGIDAELREAATMLGASSLRVFRYIDLPIASRAILVGATFAFAISLGEFGASLLLTRPEYSTIPVAIFRYLGQAGAERLGAALAMSSVLMVVSMAGFLIIERFRYRDVGEF